MTFCYVSGSLESSATKKMKKGPGSLRRRYCRGGRRGRLGELVSKISVTRTSSSRSVVIVVVVLRLMGRIQNGQGHYLPPKRPPRTLVRQARYVLKTTIQCTEISFQRRLSKLHLPWTTRVLVSLQDPMIFLITQMIRTQMTHPKIDLGCHQDLRYLVLIRQAQQWRRLAPIRFPGSSAPPHAASVGWLGHDLDLCQC